MEQGSGVAMSAQAQGVRYSEAACVPARRHGAAVEVNMKERGAGRHPMIRVTFNGKSELIKKRAEIGEAAPTVTKWSASPKGARKISHDE